MEDEGGDEGFVGEVDLRERVVEAAEGVAYECAGGFGEGHRESVPHITTVSRSVAAVEHVVDVESTSFHEVYCDDEHEGELRFTYIY